MTTTIKWVRSKNGDYASECGRFGILKHGHYSKCGQFFVIDRSRNDPVTPEFRPMATGTLRSCKSQAERWLRGRN
jgi:hypothetical protein